MKPIFVCIDCLQIWDKPGLCLQPIPAARKKCNGTLIPHYSLPDLESYLKEQVKKIADKPFDKGRPYEDAWTMTVLQMIMQDFGIPVFAETPKDLKEAV